ncbi:SpoIIE family protein phosphatase [Streptomyces chartreusis]
MLHRLDRALARHLRERAPDEHPAAEDFVTVLLLEIGRDGEITALNCGHPWPYLLSGTCVEPLARTDPLPPLGLFPLPTELPPVPCGSLLPGDCMVLYTDGVEDGLPEAAEDGGDRADGGDAVAADVTHHRAYAVLGGDDLVQVAADPGTAVRGELRRGDVQPVDARWQRPQQHALRGTGHLAHLPELTHQGPPDVQDQPGPHGEEDGAGHDPRTEAVLLGERAGQLVGDRHRAPGGGQPEREHLAGHPSLEAEHADGPPIGPDKAERTGLERPVRFCRQIVRKYQIIPRSHPIE